MTFLPRQLANIGDRLVFSNGILVLALVAGLLIVIFQMKYIEMKWKDSGRFR